VYSQAENKVNISLRHPYAIENVCALVLLQLLNYKIFFFFLENKSLPYNAVLLQSPCEANSCTIES